MTDKRTTPRRRAGRPPAGAREGERSKTILEAQYSCPNRNESTAERAQRGHRSRAVARLIVEAIDCFFHDLPDNDRELVDGFMSA